METNEGLQGPRQLGDLLLASLFNGQVTSSLQVPVSLKCQDFATSCTIFPSGTWSYRSEVV